MQKRTSIKKKKEKKNKTILFLFLVYFLMVSGPSIIVL